MKLLHRPALIAAALGLFAPALLSLGACGFTPMYATPGVTPKLAAIEVLRPDGRTGYLLGQALDDEFAKNREADPQYRLALKLKEVRVPRGLRVNNVASRYELQLTTDYELVDVKTRASVTKGVVKISVTYDSADQPYAGVAAQLEGQQRAAEQVAERIRLELASYFAAPRPAPAGAPVDASLSYSERLAPSAVLNPRERALGSPSDELTADPFGRPAQPSQPAPDQATPPPAPPSNQGPANP